MSNGGSSSFGFPFPRVAQNSGYTAEGPVLNGTTAPGQWLLVEAAREFGWEIRYANYQSGATLVPKGDPLVRARYQVKVWAALDAGKYRELLRTTLKKAVVTQAGTAGTVGGIITTDVQGSCIGIVDPALSDLGVSNVVVLRASALLSPLVASGSGCWTAEVEFLEFRPPTPAPQLKDQAMPDQGPVTPAAVEAQAHAQAAIEQGRQALSRDTRRKLIGGA